MTPVARHAPALVVYVAITVVMTWPLATNLGALVPHDLGDPLLSTWVLWWNAHVVPFTESWWDGLWFFPARDTLALSDHRVGLGWIATPLLWFGASPIGAYNAAFLVSFVASAAAAYALSFELTRSRLAAFLGGLAFGFAPSRAEHLAHLELLSSYWLPIVLLALHRWRSTLSRRWLVVAAVALTMQALSCGYYFFFSGVLLALWLIWFVPSGLSTARYTELLAALLAPLVLLMPVFLRYRDAHLTMGLGRSLEEIESLSADVIGLVTVPEALALWSSPAAWQRSEGSLFPGFVVVVLVCTGMWRAVRASPRATLSWSRARTLLLIVAAIFIAAAALPRVTGPIVFDAGFARVSIARAYKPLSVAALVSIAWLLSSPMIRAARARGSPLEFYTLATAAMWLFALGPTARLLGHRVLYKAPYAWLMTLPGYADEFRAPARFAMLAALTLSIAAAVSFRRLAGERSARLRLICASALAIGIALDSWVYPFVVVAAPAPLAVPAELPPDAAIVELPMELYADVRAVYHSTFHGRRTVNGMSGYDTPHYGILRIALEEGNVDALSALARYGNVALFLSPEAERLTPLLATQTHARPVTRTATHDVWLLPRVPQSPPAAAGQWTAVPINRVVSTANDAHIGLLRDGDHRTTWSTLTPQHGREQVTVELARRAFLGEVRLSLGKNTTAFPRVLSVELSEDTREWQQVWVGPTAALSVAAAIEDPRAVPVVFAFPAHAARYVRLTQLGTSTHPWAVGELEIFERSLAAIGVP